MENVTLSQVIALHGECWDRRGVPSFSPWYREAVVEAYGRFLDTSQLSDTRMVELTGLSRDTVSDLRHVRRAPTWRTIVRLIAAGIVDARDGAPNVAMARQLRPLGASRRLGREGAYAGWGVGEALLAWRRARGHRQRDVLDLLGASSCQQVSLWERGHHLPAPATLARLVELHIIDRATACSILDSDHFEGPQAKASTRAVLSRLRGPHR